MCKILLVEDDETSNFISKIVLKSAGISDVEEVLNGKEAYSHLQNSCPDLIFLDINMPVMSGWEFLEEMKTHALCDEVKIAMLTSSIHPDDKKMAENYPYVIAYLEKPLTQEKIEEVRSKI